MSIEYTKAKNPRDTCVVTQEENGVQTAYPEKTGHTNKGDAHPVCVDCRFNADFVSFDEVLDPAPTTTTDTRLTKAYLARDRARKLATKKECDRKTGRARNARQRKRSRPKDRKKHPTCSLLLCGDIEENPGPRGAHARGCGAGSREENRAARAIRAPPECTRCGMVGHHQSVCHLKHAEAAAKLKELAVQQACDAAADIEATYGVGEEGEGSNAPCTTTTTTTSCSPCESTPSSTTTTTTTVSISAEGAFTVPTAPPQPEVTSHVPFAPVHAANALGLRDRIRCAELKHSCRDPHCARFESTRPVGIYPSHLSAVSQPLHVLDGIRPTREALDAILGVIFPGRECILSALSNLRLPAHLARTVSLDYFNHHMSGDSRPCGDLLIPKLDKPVVVGKWVFYAPKVYPDYPTVHKFVDSVLQRDSVELHTVLFAPHLVTMGTREIPLQTSLDTVRLNARARLLRCAGVAIQDRINAQVVAGSELVTLAVAPGLRQLNSSVAVEALTRLSLRSCDPGSIAPPPAPPTNPEDHSEKSMPLGIGRPIRTFLVRHRAISVLFLMSVFALAKDVRRTFAVCHAAPSLATALSLQIGTILTQVFVLSLSVLHVSSRILIQGSYHAFVILSVIILVDTLLPCEHLNLRSGWNPQRIPRLVRRSFGRALRVIITRFLQPRPVPTATSSERTRLTTSRRSSEGSVPAATDLKLTLADS